MRYRKLADWRRQRRNCAYILHLKILTTSIKLLCKNFINYKVTVHHRFKAEGDCHRDFLLLLFESGYHRRKRLGGRHE